MKYKVTNRLEQTVNFGKIKFLPKETKILEVEPTSDRFIVEKIEEIEKPKLNNSRRLNKQNDNTRFVE